MSIISRYITLINKFTTGEIDAPQFETKYMNMFKKETCDFSDKIYYPLNSLFSSVDMYCSNPDWRDKDDLDEDDLIIEAEKTLAQLMELEP